MGKTCSNKLPEDQSKFKWKELQMDIEQTLILVKSNQNYLTQIQKKMLEEDYKLLKILETLKHVEMRLEIMETNILTFAEDNFNKTKENNKLGKLRIPTKHEIDKERYEQEDIEDYKSFLEVIQHEDEQRNKERYNNQEANEIVSNTKSMYTEFDLLLGKVQYFPIYFAIIFILLKTAEDYEICQENEFLYVVIKTIMLAVICIIFENCLIKNNIDERNHSEDIYTKELCEEDYEETTESE